MALVKIVNEQSVKIEEQTQVLIASVNKEINEKARIENNIIISGVGVGSEGEDTEKVDKVLKALNLDRSSHVKSQRRIKSSNKGNENPPCRYLDMIVVEFKNEEAKIKALREAKKLNSTELSNVYINHRQEWTTYIPSSSRAVPLLSLRP